MNRQSPFVLLLAALIALLCSSALADNGRLRRQRNVVEVEAKPRKKQRALLHNLWDDGSVNEALHTVGRELKGSKSGGKYMSMHYL